MTDYATLTDDALNIEIATRLGYTTFSAASGWFDSPEVGPEERTWVVMSKHGEGERPLPDWASDLNAAAELLNSTGLRWQIDYDTDYGMNHRAGYSVHIDGRVLLQFGAQLARAVCEAWLAWKDTAAS